MALCVCGGGLLVFHTSYFVWWRLNELRFLIYFHEEFAKFLSSVVIRASKNWGCCQTTRTSTCPWRTLDGIWNIISTFMWTIVWIYSGKTENHGLVSFNTFYSTGMFWLRRLNRLFSVKPLNEWYRIGMFVFEKKKGEKCWLFYKSVGKCSFFSDK